MSKKSKEEDFVLEEAFEELNEIIEKLEDEEISLEDSFREYKRGMELVKKCNDSIDRVEKEVMILKEGGDEGEL
jgi:exodeoxyribonuclease VII small subunit